MNLIDLRNLVSPRRVYYGEGFRDKEREIIEESLEEKGVLPKRTEYLIAERGFSKVIVLRGNGDDTAFIAPTAERLAEEIREHYS
jgi:hypothetical protein